MQCVKKYVPTEPDELALEESDVVNVFKKLEDGEILLHKSEYDKSNKITCEPSEDSDQPGHQPSLIRVFTVNLKKVWVLT